MMIQGLYAITPSGLEENDLLSKTEVLLKDCLLYTSDAADE